MSNIHQKPILAIDLGEKRVGLAISHGVVAGPMGFLDYEDQESFYRSLKKIIEEQSVGLLIIGIPLDRNGQDTKQSFWVRAESEKIARRTGLPIKFVEESYTSVEAVENLNKVKEKGEIDVASAVQILERYLNEQDGN